MSFWKGGLGYDAYLTALDVFKEELKRGGIDGVTFSDKQFNDYLKELKKNV